MKTRVISAAVGIVLLCAVLYFREIPFVLRGALGVLSAIAAFELFRAKKLTEDKPMTVLGLAVAFVLALLPTVWLLRVSGVFLFCYLVVLLLVMMRKRETLGIEQVAMAFLFSVLPALGFSTLAMLNELKGQEEFSVLTAGDTLFLIILAVGGAWIADTGAYFTGRLLGKHKLAPVISPKKTVEGFFGGILCNILIFMLIGFVYTKIDPAVQVSYWQLALLGASGAVLGCAGDLSASAVKRKAGIKDYGKIMPGHGGVMDRFDSFLFVVPAFYLLVKYCWFISPLIVR